MDTTIRYEKGGKVEGMRQGDCGERDARRRRRRRRGVDEGKRSRGRERGEDEDVTVGKGTVGKGSVWKRMSRGGKEGTVWKRDCVEKDE